MRILNPKLTSKLRFLPLAAILLATPSFADNKDLIRLQTQVQQLLDAVARLQQSNDERMGVLKDLVQQNADSVNRMSVTIDALQKSISAQQSTQGGKIDTVSGQIQSLNDSLDELKARMGRLEKAMGDVSNQQQSMSATLQNLQPPAAGTVTPPPTGPIATPPQVADAAPAPAPVAPAPVVRKTPAAIQPPVDDMYKNAFNDFMAAHYPVAQAEFNDLIKAYPDSQLAGNAWYYIGEIDYRGQHYSTAVKDYDKVIEQYSDNNKVPAAHLHKGQALIDMQLKDGGIRELRTLIQRFPNSPEAGQAKAKLRALNVPLIAPHP